MPIGRERTGSDADRPGRRSVAGTAARPAREEGPVNGFDRAFLKKVWSLASLYWLSPDRAQGLRLLAGVALLSATGLAVGAYVTYLNRDIANTLVGKHLTQFYHVILLTFAAAIIAVLAKVFREYLGGLLYIEWREWLTRYCIGQGFAHRAFYRMSLLGKVDNPDQRISDDVGSFVEGTEVFSLELIFAAAGVVTYFTILWSISAALALFLIAYAFLGTYFSAVIGRRLIGLNYNQERFQADFRFGLVHVRDHLEPIFMYGGAPQEADQLNRRFSNVVGNFKRLILWKRTLGFLTESYHGVAGLIPYAFLATAYVSGQIQFGLVVQAGTAFMSLHAALSVIVTNFPKIAQYANVIVRLSEFLTEAGAAREYATGKPAAIEVEDAACVRIEHLTVLTPRGDNTLVRDLSADVSALEPLLVQGPSGSGKTSLIRAMAGIWREGSGKVIRPALSEVMFLPQRPYMILGSLRAQLMYPRASGASDDQLLEVLNAVSLSDLPERFGGLDAEMHWADTLSPGEQQRLAFARLLLNRPRYAFLDEATSALDGPNEQSMYHLMNARNIAYMSSGHRSSLLKYHRNTLQLLPNRGWRVEPILSWPRLPPPHVSWLRLSRPSTSL
jgi:vitamin B12/bleomycin/antimicrobial peptide transport system ATP-binding/permease protein